MTNKEAYELLVCLQEEMRQKGREEQYNALQVAIDRLKLGVIANETSN